MTTLESMHSYSRLRRARPADVHAPANLAEVAALLRRAGEDGRRATFRGGGRSFDDQALNDDVIIDMKHFDAVLSVDPAKRRVTTQGAASWGAIADASLAHGLFPHIVVTTSAATAAGTLSANCMSRSSATFGHTGDHVVSLTLLTPNGEVLTCSRQENAELFRAVVGGFGYFGVVTEVTFDLLEIGHRRNVRTVVERREGLAAFTERLTEASLDPGPYHAIYSVYSLAAPQRGAVLRSAYTDEPLGHRLQIYRPFTWYRPLAELLFVSGRISNALCHASYKLEFSRGTFVDDLRGYTFCMEGNERMKTLADKVRVPIASVQHSYAVPTTSLRAFLETSARLFQKHDVYPSLLDALYRPADDFLLSSAHGLPGFAVSFVFEGVASSRFERLIRCLHEVNDASIDIGGRLHLTKNVYATKEQLRSMYGHALDAFHRIKAQCDPRNVLVNDFLVRAFG